MKRVERAFGTALLLAVAGATPQAGEATPPSKPGFTLADLKAQIPQDKHGAFLMELPQILNTAADPEVRSLLGGQTVVTTGQVMAATENSGEGTHLRIFRSQVSCCAEHARQCRIFIDYAGKLPAFRANSWIRVIGTISYRQKDGVAEPFLRACAIHEAAPPADLVLR